MDIVSWSVESFTLAKNYGYEGLDLNEEVPENYVNDRRMVAESQIVLGGKRLAYVIEKIFGNDEKPEPIVNDVPLFLQH